MSYNPYGGKYTYGGSLKHGRTKGSRNGYRSDGSIPTGKPAEGVIVGRRPDGTPIYMYKRGNGDKQSVKSIDAKTAMQLTRNNGNKGKNVRSNTLRYGRDQRNAMRNARSNKQNISSNSTRASSQERIDKQRAYDKSLIGRLDNATKGVRSAVGDWFNKRREVLKSNINRIGRAAKTAYEAISNSDERKAYEKAQANFKRNPNAETKKARDDAKKAYDSHLLTRLRRDPIGTAKSEIKNTVDNAKKAVSNQDEFEAMETARIKSEKAGNSGKNKGAAAYRDLKKAEKAYDNHILTKLSGNTSKKINDARRQAKIDSDFRAVSAKLADLQVSVDYAKTDGERQKLIMERDKYYDEVFKPAEAAYKDSHRKKKKK